MTATVTNDVRPLTTTRGGERWWAVRTPTGIVREMTTCDVRRIVASHNDMTDEAAGRFWRRALATIQTMEGT